MQGRMNRKTARLSSSTNPHSAFRNPQSKKRWDLEATPEKKKRARQIIRLLKKEYPGARCSLDHSNPLELLVATILSAQCTDERVNLVTADLFRKYRSAEDYAAAPVAKLERDITRPASSPTRP